MKTLINGHEVTFDEETHSYTVDGVKAYSVTKIIGWKLKSKYSGIDASILSKAADYGNKIHEAIEDYEMLGVKADLTELDDYIWLKKQYNWEVDNSEIFVILPYKSIWICGKIDLVAHVDVFKYLMDIKTTATLDKASLAMQLTLYKMAYKYSYGADIDYLAYIWINSKGNNSYRKFGEIQANESFMLSVLEEFSTFMEMGFLIWK